MNKKLIALLVVSFISMQVMASETQDTKKLILLTGSISVNEQGEPVDNNGHELSSQVLIPRYQVDGALDNKAQTYLQAEKISSLIFEKLKNEAIAEAQAVVNVKKGHVIDTTIRRTTFRRSAHWGEPLEHLSGIQ